MSQSFETGCEALETSVDKKPRAKVQYSIKSETKIMDNIEKMAIYRFNSRKYFVIKQVVHVFSLKHITVFQLKIIKLAQNLAF